MQRCDKCPRAAEWHLRPVHDGAKGSQGGPGRYLCSQHLADAAAVLELVRWTCEHCGLQQLRAPQPGRPPKFCTPACRTAAWRAKQ
jgi:hypothetical protein